MSICIAREFGSGGHEIGKYLAKSLGYIFYDQAVVTEAVQKGNFDTDDSSKQEWCDVSGIVPVRKKELGI